MHQRRTSLDQAGDRNELDTHYVIVKETNLTMVPKVSGIFGKATCFVRHPHLLEKASVPDLSTKANSNWW